MRTLSQKSHKLRTTCTFSGSAAIALLWCCASFWLSSPAIASDDSATISAIHTDTTSIKLDVEDIRDFLDYSNNAFALRGTENKLDSVITQTTATQQKLQSILSFLNYNAGAGSTDNVRYYLQQLLASQQALAANPWWSTNSEFALGWSAWTGNVPKPTSGNVNHGDFTDVLSTLISARMRLRKDLTSIIGGYSHLPSGWVKTWGHNGSSLPYNETMGQVYTFEDWIADAWRSNWVLQASTIAYSTNELASWAASTGASSTLGEVPRTNALQDLVISQPNNSAVASSLSGVFQDGPNIDDVLPSMTSASPEIVILDAGTNAGHAVPRVAATLDNSVVSWIRVVASWAWRLAGVVALWMILRTEYGYWTTLGQGGAE